MSKIWRGEIMDHAPLFCEPPRFFGDEAKFLLDLNCFGNLLVRVLTLSRDEGGWGSPWSTCP
jgi:hypothetical protein